MSFSDWIKSDKSERVWLEDSMTALGQFAFVNPLHRVKHYVQSKNRRVDCWAERTGKCIYCENGIMKVNDYTYGIFTEKGDNTIKYMGSVNLSTHTLIQNIFSDLFDNNINPCDLVFEITKLIPPVTSEKFISSVSNECFYNKLAPFPHTPQIVVLKYWDIGLNGCLETGS